MGKKSRKYNDELYADSFEEAPDFQDDDLDFEELSRDIYSTEWGHYSEDDDSGGSRRKAGRRHKRKRSYSELDDWEEFGESESWYDE